MLTTGPIFTNQMMLSKVPMNDPILEIQGIENYWKSSPAGLVLEFEVWRLNGG